MAAEPLSLTHMSRARLGAELIYWLGVPLVVGLLIGWFRVGGLDPQAKLAVAGFWAVFVLYGWCTNAVYTWLAKVLLKPWQPPLWFLTLFGALVIGVVNVVPMNQLLLLGQANLPLAVVPMAPLRIELSASFLMFYLAAVLPGALLWTGVNGLYDRVLGIPRFRYGPAPAAAPAAAPVLQPGEPPPAAPAILRRVADENRGELLALHAQEHYVMVYTSRGSELINYSFGNALQDLEPGLGMQVHRSWWVARDAVTEMERAADKWQLQLKNGLEVPVSRSHVNAAKQAFR